MKSCLPLVSLLGALTLSGQAWASETGQTCVFQTICSGQNDCEAAKPDSSIEVLLSDDTATVDLGRHVATLHLRDGVAGNTTTFFGAEPDTSGGMMLSVFSDATVAVTIHGNLFGPVVLTAFGRCEAQS